jgi:hypothetical protein
MTWINGTPRNAACRRSSWEGSPSRRCSLSAPSPPANAEWRGDHHGHNWGGGYYGAPPVVYGSPYGNGYYGAPGYYAPPVVYGPAVGIGLPGRRHRHPISSPKSETATAGSNAGRFSLPAPSK